MRRLNKQPRARRLLASLLGGATFAGALSIGGCAPSGAEQEIPRPETYSFWPLFPAEPRVQFLTSYRFSDDVEPTRSGLEDIIYGEERRVLPINKPYGVDMYDGKIYVCDTRNAGVIILDLANQETRLMGATGQARTRSPTDIAIAPDGMTYVTDAVRRIIFVFDGQERYVTAFGREGMRPTGIDVHGDELFVCDFESQTVQVLDRRTGELLRSIGEPGDADGQFVRPLGVAVGEDGIVHVSDVIQCEVQKFTPDGTFVSKYGEVGDAIGTFARPKLTAVDREGITYVVDAAFANVQMFSADDELLMFFGSTGSHPGSMYLPAGVEVFEGGLEYFEPYIHPDFDAQRLILVTNQFGVNKVSVYALGQLKEGSTVQDIATSRAAIEDGMIEGDEAARDQLLPPVERDTPEPGAEGAEATEPEASPQQETPTEEPNSNAEGEG
jgi:hypothetical protein